jgi:RNA polymerase sigma-70 factor (ECF subfamily)
MESMESTENCEELVRRAQAGERAAFETLIRGSEERLRAVIELRLKAPLRQAAEVDDALQETLLRAWQGIGRFRWEGAGSFERWLAGIAARVIFEAASRERRRAVGSLEDEVAAGDPTPSRRLRREERFTRLEEALAKLSPEHRQVILLARLEKLPLKEIALRMDRSPAAASQLLLRALHKLKEAFGETESLRLPPRALGGEGRGEGRQDG